jgi:hypothetical protein
MKPLARIVRRKDGAAIAELVIAIVPILILFFTIAQFAAIGFASLLVRHAAFVAARCQAVVHTNMADVAGAGNEPTTAAGVVLSTVPGKLTSVSSTAVDPLSQLMSTTTVSFDYRCGVPLGGLFVCGRGGTRTLSASASFPNQGSYYQHVWGQ